MRRVVLIGVVVLTLTSAAGCGEGSGPAAPITTTAAVSTTAPSATARSTTTAPAATTPPTPPEVVAFCAEVTANRDALANPDPNAQRQFVAALAKLLAVAPAAIKDDLTIWHDALADALRTNDTRRLDDADVAEAGTRVYLYLSTQCSVDL